MCCYDNTDSPLSLFPQPSFSAMAGSCPRCSRPAVKVTKRRAECALGHPWTVVSGRQLQERDQ